jgi:anaerobic ribonucleoside-triphosphate reductase activating protein
MKIAKICSSTLYEGLSCEIFISGCKHGCKGCQNPDLWDFNYGKEMSLYQILEEIALRNRWIDNVVLTGGDPLWSSSKTLELIKAIRKEFPKLSIWLYTGFMKEEIDTDPAMKECFNLCDVIITDRYMEGLPKTKLTGSSNQRIWRKEATVRASPRA